MRALHAAMHCGCPNSVTVVSPCTASETVLVNGTSWNRDFDVEALLQILEHGSVLAHQLAGLH